MRKGKIKIIAGVLMIGLLVSGCQSAGGDKAAETAETTVTETQKVTETATPTPEVKETATQTATPTPEPTKEAETVKAEEVKDDTSDQKDSEQTTEEKPDSNNQETEENKETEDGGNKAVIQVWEEGGYVDDRFTDPEFRDPACQIEVSNVTDTSFDFTVYEVTFAEGEEVKTVIFNTNTATFLPGGTEAVFKGKKYTLHFTFPDYMHSYPYATAMEVTGFSPLEGNSYFNGSIPGHEFG